jgi:hypothetical protein
MNPTVGAGVYHCPFNHLLNLFSGDEIIKPLIMITNKKKPTFL